jgi:RNA polymerase sigma factor (sigma-70 family)
MSDASLDAVRMQHCVERWQAGDVVAADDLFRLVGQPLEHITRKMLRGFPAIQVYANTADVLQSSVLRLLSTQMRMKPESTRHSFNLAVVHVRRELLDLARRNRRVDFARPASARPADDSRAEVVAAPAEDDELDLWCRFHEAVEQLPAEEREVIGLTFYHGWTQAQIAELFQVDERTIRRRWRSAYLNLSALLGGRLPTVECPRREPAGLHSLPHRRPPTGTVRTVRSSAPWRMTSGDWQ